MNAMQQLPPDEHSKLSKLLALIGSDHIGERDNAISAASRLLERHRLRWSEILQLQAHVEIRPQQEAQYRNPDSDPIHGRDWRKVCANCRKHPRYVNAWEDNFLRDVPLRSSITIRQRETLIRIVLRLQALGCVV